MDDGVHTESSTRSASRKRAPVQVKSINLALQGGGAHGAFTWGVLTGLIEDGRIEIEGISGTSAGAVNALMVADGLAHGRPQEACKRLADFWRAASLDGNLPALQRAVIDRLFSFMPLEGSPAQAWFDALSRFWSPYDLNPLNINPLREVLEDLVDFESLRGHPDIKLFVTASNVRTCKSRVFRTPELTVDTLMASACLPLMFKAVEIEGEHYWDGGYLGNPAISPLIDECASSDVVIVQVNPMNRPEVPETMRDILNRINEMTFNASLVREMHGIATISRLIETGALDDERYTTVRFHQIGAEAELAKYGALSKMNTERPFLQHLHDLGYATAESWIAENFERLGWDSTVDVLDKYV